MAETTTPDSGAASGPGTCQWPGGCVNDAPVRAGGGRPPAYCGQEVLGVRHDRANAATRRRQLREAGVSTQRAVSEPVTVARAAAGSMLARLESAIAEQARIGAALVAELRTMGDPTAAAAQASAATETARADAATARAEAAEAADAQATAEADADVARQEAETAAAAQATAKASAAAAAQDAAAARAELAAQIQATGEQAVRAETAEAEAEQLRQQLDRVTGERDALAGRLTETLATLTDVRETARADAAAAAAREASAAEQITRLTNDLDTTRSRVEQLHTELRTADRATAEQTARADRAEADTARITQALTSEQTAHTTTRGQLDDLRTDLAQHHADSAARAATSASAS